MRETLTSLLKRLKLRLKPGLSDKELALVIADWPRPPPLEIRELLHFASGFDTHSTQVDLTGRAHKFGWWEVLPYGSALAATRDGNLWVVDIHADGSWHEVFYLSHDPPVVLVYFPSLHDFIEELAEHPQAENRASVLASRIYKSGSPGRIAGQLTASADMDLQRFAASVPSNYEIFDFRGIRLPAGFTWGSTGPSTDCRRFGLNLLFAVPRRGGGRRSKTLES